MDTLPVAAEVVVMFGVMVVLVVVVGVDNLIHILLLSQPVHQELLIPVVEVAALEGLVLQEEMVEVELLLFDIEFNIIHYDK